MRKKNILQKYLVVVLIGVLVNTIALPALSNPYIFQSTRSTPHIPNIPQPKTINRASSIFEQSADELWNTTYGDNLNEYARSVQQTMDGGFIIAGSVNSGYSSKYDILLLKTDTYGHTEWVKKFGGSEHEYAYAVDICSDQGYIICGYTNSYGAGEYDVWLIRTDAHGNELWNKTFGTSYGWDSARSAHQTSDDGFIIVGSKALDDWPWSNLWLIRLDKNGNTKWSRDYGLGGLHKTNGEEVVEMDDGGFMAIGRAFTNDPPTRNTDQPYKTRQNDLYIVRTDSQGNRLWYNRTGDQNLNEWGKDIVKTSDGNYVILSSKQSYGAWILKTDPEGKEIWSTYHQAGEKTATRGTLVEEIQETKDKGFVFVGQMRWKRRLYEGTYPWREAWIVKTDIAGQKEWQYIPTGRQNDSFNAVWQTQDEGFIAVGQTDSYGNGSSDLWNVKILPSPSKPYIYTDNQGIKDILKEFTFVSYDPRDNDISYYIDWGDGTNTGWIGPYTSGQNITYSHTWTDRGYYKMQITARDSLYNLESFIQTKWISISNDQPQNTVISGPDTGVQGYQYNFTFQSIDNESDDLFYYIDWGDSSKEKWIGPYPANTTIIRNHTYLKEDVYTIAAKAQDIFGEQSSWTNYTIIIANHAPTKPTIDGKDNGEIWLEYTFTFNATDQDNHTISYYISWGDGEFEPWSTQLESGQEYHCSHIWYDTGDFIIKAQARDQFGKESSVSYHQISIGNQAPTSPDITGKTNGKIDVTYNYTFVSTDHESHRVAYYINWGDGTYDDWTEWKNPGREITISHKWTEEGSYRVRAQARDEAGALSNWATLEVEMPHAQNTYADSPLLRFFEHLQQRFPFLERLLTWSFHRLQVSRGDLI